VIGWNGSGRPTVKTTGGACSRRSFDLDQNRSCVAPFTIPRKRGERLCHGADRSRQLPKPPLAPGPQAFLINGEATIARDDTTPGGQHVGPKGNSILTPLEEGLLSKAARLRQTNDQFRAGGVDR
jgi:hypothetical protein